MLEPSTASGLRQAQRCFHAPQQALHDCQYADPISPLHTYLANTPFAGLCPKLLFGFIYAELKLPQQANRWEPPQVQHRLGLHCWAGMSSARPQGRAAACRRPLLLLHVVTMRISQTWTTARRACICTLRRRPSSRRSSGLSSTETFWTSSRSRPQQQQSMPER